MELEIEFKRQVSHGPFNYYMSKQEQLMKNQKIQIIDIEYTKEDKEIIKESNALTSLLIAKANLPPPKTTDSGLITPREREKHKQRVLELLQAYDSSSSDPESEGKKSSDSFTKDYMIPPKVFEIEKQLL
jgi:hypothetical protein